MLACKNGKQDIVKLLLGAPRLLRHLFKSRSKSGIFQNLLSISIFSGYLLMQPLVIIQDEGCSVHHFFGLFGFCQTNS